MALRLKQYFCTTMADVPERIKGKDGKTGKTIKSSLFTYRFSL